MEISRTVSATNLAVKNLLDTTASTQLSSAYWEKISSLSLSLPGRLSQLQSDVTLNTAKLNKVLRGLASLNQSLSASDVTAKLLAVPTDITGMKDSVLQLSATLQNLAKASADRDQLSMLTWSDKLAELSSSLGILTDQLAVSQDLAMNTLTSINSWTCPVTDCICQPTDLSSVEYALQGISRRACSDEVMTSLHNLTSGVTTNPACFTVTVKTEEFTVCPLTTSTSLPFSLSTMKDLVAMAINYR